MTTTDLWTYPQSAIGQVDITGFKVEAIDGDIGKVDRATNDVGGSYLILDTGPWIFGRKVVLPAGVIRDVDLDAEAVFVARTKEQIKNAPEFDEQMLESDTYRSELGAYYGPGGAGHRDVG
jgi:hypothetical protein